MEWFDAFANRLLDFGDSLVPQPWRYYMYRLSQETRDLTGIYFQPRCWPTIFVILILSAGLAWWYLARGVKGLDKPTPEQRAKKFEREWFRQYRGVNRSGFTIVELLVVIGILLLLSAVTLAVYSIKNSSLARDGSRNLQSAIMGAKDRAVHAKQSRGVRLIVDPSNSNFVTGLTYIQEIPHPRAGAGELNVNTGDTSRSVTVVRPDTIHATQILISGSEGQALFRQDSQGLWPSKFAKVQVPIGGIWYNLVASGQNGARYCSVDQNGNTVLNVQNDIVATNLDHLPPNYIATPPDSSLASLEVFVGHEVMPFHQPVSLVGAIVDLRLSQGVSDMDLIFQPSGTASALWRLFIRDVRDAMLGLDPSSQKLAGDQFIVSVTRQGLVKTSNVDVTDANGDGIADNPFRFANQP